MNLLQRLLRRPREHHATAQEVHGVWFVDCPDCSATCKTCRGRSLHMLGVARSEDDATLIILDHQNTTQEIR